MCLELQLSQRHKAVKEKRSPISILCNFFSFLCLAQGSVTQTFRQVIKNRECQYDLCLFPLLCLQEPRCPGAAAYNFSSANYCRLLALSDGTIISQSPAAASLCSEKAKLTTKIVISKDFRDGKGENIIRRWHRLDLSGHTLLFPPVDEHYMTHLYSHSCLGSFRKPCHVVSRPSPCTPSSGCTSVLNPLNSNCEVVQLFVAKLLIYAWDGQPCR